MILDFVYYYRELAYAQDVLSGRCIAAASYRGSDTGATSDHLTPQDKMPLQFILDIFCHHEITTCKLHWKN